MSRYLCVRSELFIARVCFSVSGDFATSEVMHQLEPKNFFVISGITLYILVDYSRQFFSHTKRDFGRGQKLASLYPTLRCIRRRLYLSAKEASHCGLTLNAWTNRQGKKPITTTEDTVHIFGKMPSSIAMNSYAAQE